LESRTITDKSAKSRLATGKTMATAAAITGPASGPRPASSTPIASLNPHRKQQDSQTKLAQWEDFNFY
jgi:hypothetical protein